MQSLQMVAVISIVVLAVTDHGQKMPAFRCLMSSWIECFIPPLELRKVTSWDAGIRSIRKLMRNAASQVPTHTYQIRIYMLLTLPGKAHAC